MGARLIVRRGHGSEVLTREGARVLEGAQEVLRLCGELRGDAATQAVSSLTIAASSAPLRALVPDLLERFSRRCPSCLVTVMTGSSDDVRRAVSDGDALVGLLGSADDRGNLEYRLVASDELVLVTPDNEVFRRARDEGALGRDLIGGAAMVARDAGSGTQRAVDGYLASLEAVIGTRIDRPRYRVASADLALDLVEHGMGVTVASTMTAAPRLRAGGLLSFSLDEPPVERSVYLALSRDALLGAPAQEFLDVLDEKIAEL